MADPDLGGSAFGRLRADARGLSPVIGKTLEIGVVVLYVGLLTSVLYGGVVPDYRTAAGEALGDRVVATAADRIEAATPPNAARVESAVRVDLPATIRGEGYRIRAVDDATLVLDHPLDEVSGRARLALPPSVASVRGEWSSQNANRLLVRSGPGGLRMRLEGP